MSVKITLVENHINRNFKQYNIDEFTIKENFGSVEFFRTFHKDKMYIDTNGDGGKDMNVIDWIIENEEENTTFGNAGHENVGRRNFSGNILDGQY